MLFLTNKDTLCQILVILKLWSRSEKFKGKCCANKITDILIHVENKMVG